MLVRNVDDFPDHIVCDARAKSAVVIPVFDGAGALIAVLDVDAAATDAFDEADVKGLTRLVAWFGTPRPEPRPALG